LKGTRAFNQLDQKGFIGFFPLKIPKAVNFLGKAGAIKFWYFPWFQIKGIGINFSNFPPRQGGNPINWGQIN